MNKFFKENGFLSEEGIKLVQPLQNALLDIMNSSDVNSMSEQELQILQANFAKIVGDTISNSIREKTESFAFLFKMADYEFAIHMKEKYGPQWQLKSLTKEELKRAIKFVDNALSAADSDK